MDLSTIDKIIFPQGGRYLWGALSGGGNSGKRQAVMQALGQKLPKSKCGYNFVIDELFKAYGIPYVQGVTPSEREKQLVAAIKGE